MKTRTENGSIITQTAILPQFAEPKKKRVAFSPFFSFASSAKATSTVVYTVGKAAAEAGVHFAGRGTKSCHGVVASVETDLEMLD